MITVHRARLATTIPHAPFPRQAQVELQDPLSLERKAICPRPTPRTLIRLEDFVEKISATWVDTPAVTPSRRVWTRCATLIDPRWSGALNPICVDGRLRKVATVRRWVRGTTAGRAAKQNGSGGTPSSSSATAACRSPQPSTPSRREPRRPVAACSIQTAVLRHSSTSQFTDFISLALYGKKI